MSGDTTDTRYDPKRHITQADQASPLGAGPELCSKEGAEKHARMIREFWHRRGYWWIEAWVGLPYKMSNDGRGLIYPVLTNLLPGCLPPPRPPGAKPPADATEIFRVRQPEEKIFRNADDEYA